MTGCKKGHSELPIGFGVGAFSNHLREHWNKIQDCGFFQKQTLKIGEKKTHYWTFFSQPSILGKHWIKIQILWDTCSSPSSSLRMVAVTFSRASFVKASLTITDSFEPSQNACVALSTVWNGDDCQLLGGILSSTCVRRLSIVIPGLLLGVSSDQVLAETKRKLVPTSCQTIKIANKMMNKSWNLYGSSQPEPRALLPHW